MKIKIVLQEVKSFSIDSLNCGDNVSIAFRFWFFAIILSDIYFIQ